MSEGSAFAVITNYRVVQIEAWVEETRTARLRAAMRAFSQFLIWVEIEATVAQFRSAHFPRRSRPESPFLDRCLRETALCAALDHGKLTLWWAA